MRYQKPLVVLFVLICVIAPASILAKEADVIDPEKITDQARTLYEEDIAPKAQETFAKTHSRLEIFRKNAVKKLEDKVKIQSEKIKVAREDNTDTEDSDEIESSDGFWGSVVRMITNIKWGIVGMHAKKSAFSTLLLICNVPVLFYGIGILVILVVLYFIGRQILRMRRRRKYSWYHKS